MKTISPRGYPNGNRIVALRHGHTFAVELAARLLSKGIMKPKAILDKRSGAEQVWKPVTYGMRNFNNMRKRILFCNT